MMKALLHSKKDIIKRTFDYVFEGQVEAGWHLAGAMFAKVDGRGSG